MNEIEVDLREGVDALQHLLMMFEDILMCEGVSGTIHTYDNHGNHLEPDPKLTAQTMKRAWDFVERMRTDRDIPWWFDDDDGTASGSAES